MEKFISIPNTLGANQLISSNHVLAVVSTETGTSTTITYLSGKVVTISTTPTNQVNYNMRNAIQNAIAASAAYNWTEPVYVIPSLPIACVLITVA
jgi:hypothetical protein